MYKIFKVNDIVRLSDKFLQELKEKTPAIIIGNESKAKGVVRHLEIYYNKFQNSIEHIVLTIDWNTKGIPERVNSNNLVKI